MGWRGDETELFVFDDAGCQGVEKREEARNTKAEW